MRRFFFVFLAVALAAFVAQSASSATHTRTGMNLSCPNNRIVRLRFTGNRVTLSTCSSTKELRGVLPWKRVTS